MSWNPGIRGLVGAGTALAVVAGIGIGVATSSSAARQRYVTATAGTGDVTQTYVGTGTITRRNTSPATFAVDGTVRKVNVAVGDEVDAGDVLAVLSKGDLQLAVLNAETSVARAKAALYAARHPGSSAGSGGSAGSAGGSSSSGGTGGTASGISIDPAVLNEAVARMNLAVVDEAGKCDAIFSAILPEAEPTASATGSASPTSTATATATATATPSASPTSGPTGTVPASSTPTATPTPTAVDTPASADDPVATASPSQLAKTLTEGEFTGDQLQACANARAEVILANTNLQTMVAGLVKAKPAGGSTGKSSGSSTAAASSSSSVSAAQVASAKADLLKAQQELASAQEDLGDADLVAPISGTVGSVELATGASASAGSITIVGTGSALVALELPLATRELVDVGQAVTVAPAGSTRTLTGKITSIATLATDGTSGSSPTYATTVSVSDAGGLLASGAKASVQLPVKSATGVLRVPASAVTPTGTGTATVQVVANPNATTATTVQVRTGAVGGGWVQVSEGLQAGTLVVLADNTAAIPANQSNRRSSSTSTATASANPSASAGAVPTAGGQSSSVPSAAATGTAGR